MGCKWRRCRCSSLGLFLSPGFQPHAVASYSQWIWTEIRPAWLDLNTKLVLVVEHMGEPHAEIYISAFVCQPCHCRNMCKQLVTCLWQPLFTQCASRVAVALLRVCNRCHKQGGCLSSHRHMYKPQHEKARHTHGLVYRSGRGDTRGVCLEQVGGGWEYLGIECDWPRHRLGGPWFRLLVDFQVSKRAGKPTSTICS